jgi:hypothetical protein
MIDPISSEYLSLSFAIRRLFPDFIDAYFGPPEIEESAKLEPDPEPAELVRRALALADRVAAGDYPDSRKLYLSAQIRAMESIARRLAGEEIAYVDEVRTCFDIEPMFTPESTFEAAIEELESLLPGQGDVRERMITRKAGFVVTPDVARQLIDLINEETCRRTEAFVPLPPGNEVEIRFVEDKPWGGYNWYLGDYRSRVDVNTDLPIHANRLPDLLAHEAYPGHHTEHALKEQVLYRERGYGEHAIQLINTPECVISEGIATLAESIIFPGDESHRWQAETLYPVAGIDADPERDAAIAKATAALRAVSSNAALLLHAEGRPEAEVIDYLVRYRLATAEEGRQQFRFIADPTWRVYAFTYYVGRDLIGRWLDLAPAAERLARFRRLLIDQIAPSQISAEVEATAS